MSHADPSYTPTHFERMTIEETIEYVETHLDELVAGLRANKSIPPEDAEALAESYANFRWEVENAIPWEEVAKEFMQD